MWTRSSSHNSKSSSDNIQTFFGLKIDWDAARDSLMWATVLVSSLDFLNNGTDSDNNVGGPLPFWLFFVFNSFDDTIYLNN